MATFVTFCYISQSITFARRCVISFGSTRNDYKRRSLLSETTKGTDRTELIWVCPASIGFVVFNTKYWFLWKTFNTKLRILIFLKPSKGRKMSNKYASVQRTHSSCDTDSFFIGRLISFTALTVVCERRFSRSNFSGKTWTKCGNPQCWLTQWHGEYKVDT